LYQQKQNNMNALTIKDLYEALKEEIKKGNLNKKILISSDDEGNSYHQLFFLITPTDKMKFSGNELPFSVSVEQAEKEYVVLG